MPPGVALFLTDDHAGHSVEYSEMGAAEARRVLEPLHAHYALTGSTDRLQAIGRININSANYRLGDYYVKMLVERPGMDYVEAFPVIAAALREGGLPVGTFLPNKRGELVTRLDDGAPAARYLYVQPFIAGDFFSGAAAQFDTCGALPPLLARAVASIAPTEGQREPYRSWRPREALQDVEDAVRDAVRKSGDDFDALVRANLDIVRDAVESYDVRSGAFTARRLAHMDLHPHNLLFASGELRAILDLESFRTVPQQTAAGFCLFKLGRKSISLNELTLKEFKRRAGSRADLAALYEFVRIELARRLLTVLKLHYLERNTQWDGDLFKHLAGLSELRVMFL
jgi:hypothetical protein